MWTRAKNRGETFGSDRRRITSREDGGVPITEVLTTGVATCGGGWEDITLN